MSDHTNAHLEDQRAAEREKYASVTPDWPTYHNVIKQAADCREAMAARRAKDVGDYLAFRGAIDALREIADLANVHPESDFGKLVQNVIYGHASESMMKAAATGISKRVAANNIAAEKAHENQRVAVASIAASNDEAVGKDAIVNVRPSPNGECSSKIGVMLVSSKKHGKPFLATLGDDLTPSFVDGEKHTNTCVRFSRGAFGGRSHPFLRRCMANGTRRRASRL